MFALLANLNKGFIGHTSYKLFKNATRNFKVIAFKVSHYVYKTGCWYITFYKFQNIVQLNSYPKRRTSFLPIANQN